MAFWNDLVNTVANSFDPLNIFGGAHGNSASSSATGTGSILGDTWDKFKNGNSNDVNWQIAQDNLGYQKERAAIEDARYTEETAYNRAFQENERDYQRAFAEEERDYNRALQQQLFEREDTALERQAQSLSSMGINPLSQQLNGLGAGSPVTSSLPGGASEPTSSSRGGQALHNDFQQVPGGIEGALSALSGLANTVNGVATGQYQRDSLALENDRKLIENMILANKNGIQYYAPSSKKYSKNKNDIVNGYAEDYWNEQYGSSGYKDLNDRREYESKKSYNVFDWESPQTKLLKSVGSLDFQNLAENLLTNVANAGNWVNTNFKDFSKDMENNAIMNFIKKFFAF